MDHFEFIGIVFGGFAAMSLPFILPLFYCLGTQRRLLFYLVGVACSYFCYKVAIFLWALIAFAIGSLLASWRHEDFQASTAYSFALIAPGLKQGHMFMGLLPVLVLGSLLSVIALKILRSAFPSHKSS